MTQLTQFPRDPFTMMMVPCRRSFNINMRYHLYYCPTSYSHRQKAKYLGLYVDKSIRGIGKIRKRVECSVDMEATRVIADDLEQDQEQRILDAVREAMTRGWDIRHDRRFYICDEIVPTDFKKKSAGGIRSHQYDDLGKRFGDDDLPEVGEIAKRLREESF